jgi:hypothetical protein
LLNYEAIRDPQEIPELRLAAGVLASGGTVKLRAFGSSMLPSIWPGDVLTIEGSPHSVPVPGDIVLVLRNQRPFIHRVEEMRDCNGRRQWITRGDAVPKSDPLVEDSELLGKVLLIQRNRRVIIPGLRLSTAARLLAPVLCHWDRFRSICLRMHSLRQDLGQRARKGFANV